jgi:hypothetical protein
MKSLNKENDQLAAWVKVVKEENHQFVSLQEHLESVKKHDKNFKHLSQL